MTSGLVGRTAERQQVEGLVAGARVGRSGVLVVTGEAGMGKTTLLDHAAGVADDITVLRAAGSEAEQDVPFGGLAQLLRPSEQDLARIPAPQAHALAVALALREGVVTDRLAVGAAVLSLLVRYSEHRPLGLLLDDAHLLDRPSGEALAFACRRFLADSVFVLAAARSGEPCALTEAGLPAVELRGLDPEEAADLVRGQGERPTPERVRALLALTGGNPLALRELAGDPAAGAAPHRPGRVPAALVEAFGRRITALPPSTRRLLLVVATADGDLPVITRVCADLGLPLDAVSDAERAGLVTVHDHRVEFRHPLVRSSVYALAYPDQRRELHAAVARALPEREVDRRAWHLAEAALGPDEEVARLMAAVAGRAEARGAHAVAAGAFDRAAALSPDDAGRAERLLRAGEAAWRAGDAGRAGAALDRALLLDGSAAAQVRALAVRGDVAARQGSPSEAYRLLVRAAEHAVADDPSQAVLLLCEGICAAFYQGDAAAAVAAGERVGALLGPGSSALAAALGTMAQGMALLLAGGPGTEQVRVGAGLLDAAPADQVAQVRPAWLMYGPLFLRESGSSRALVRTALDQGRARSAVSSLPTLLFTLARDGATTEHWTGAEADYHEAITLARELGHTTELAMSLAGLAWLEARQGRAGSCREHVAQTLELLEHAPVTTARVWAGYALGELALATGDAPGAVRELTEVQAFLDRIGLHDPDVSPVPELVEALLRQGEREPAAALAAGHAEAAEAKGLPWSRARSARLAGLLCPPDELDQHFARCLALHAQTLDAFEAARSRLVYGARLRRTRRRAAAREPLRAALATFERLGAQPWADAAAAELEATGETAARSGDSALDVLTPRELQIVLLLAEGRTTREAAAALFLSPKTVEYHLRNVYLKLDVATRAELLDLVDRAGAG